MHACVPGQREKPGVARIRNARMSNAHAESAWAFPPSDHALYKSATRAQRLRVHCPDGATLFAWTSIPLTQPALMIMLYFYGSGEVVSKLTHASDPTAPGGSLPTFRDLIDHLAADSIRTVLVEYRGFGDNEALGPPSLSSMLADAESCFLALALPEDRVCVMGRSIGFRFRHYPSRWHIPCSLDSSWRAA